VKFFRYLNESNRGRSLIIVDIDETVFKTYAMIRVVKDGKEVARLSNQEFNSYKLKPGETFDFSEFTDAKFFYETSKPIIKMIEKLKKMIENNAKVIFLTARADLDNKDIFLSTFKKFGLNPDKFYVERSGNLKRGSVPERKMYIIVKKYLSTGIYRRAYIYDDFLLNCIDFLDLYDKIPSEIIENIKKVNNIIDPNEPVLTLKAYQVLQDGSIREVKK